MEGRRDGISHSLKPKVFLFRLERRQQQQQMAPNPNCANSSNPYHECTQACTSQKKHTNNKHQHTTNKRRINTTASSGDQEEVGKTRTHAAACAKAANPYHHCDHNCFKQLKPHNNSQPQLIQPHKEDKVASVSITPYSEQEQGGPLTLTTSADSNEVVSEPRIPVEGYNVKESYAAILRSILDKYGDIGATSHLESPVMRSHYIDCVCFVVQQLQQSHDHSSLMHLNHSKINELLAILKDVESAQLRIPWLRTALHEIQLIRRHQDAEAAKTNSDAEAESLREELESQLQTLADKEREVADIKTRIPQIRDRLTQLDDKTMLSTNSMVEITFDG